jgi:hypothetical protein
MVMAVGLVDPDTGGAETEDLLGARVEQLEHALGDRLGGGGRDRVADLLAPLFLVALEHEPLPTLGSDGEFGRVPGPMPDRDPLQHGELEVSHRAMEAAVGRLDDQPARAATWREVEFWPEQLEAPGHPELPRHGERLAGNEPVRGLEQSAIGDARRGRPHHVGSSHA